MRDTLGGKKRSKGRVWLCWRHCVTWGHPEVKPLDAPDQGPQSAAAVPMLPTASSQLVERGKKTGPGAQEDEIRGPQRATVPLLSPVSAPIGSFRTRDAHESGARGTGEIVARTAGVWGPREGPTDPLITCETGKEPDGSGHLEKVPPPPVYKYRCQ